MLLKKRISSSSYWQLLNLLLRIVNLSGRFLLLIFLAKALTLAELGLYGVLVASISYAVYLVGLDFYTYSTRNLIEREFRQIGKYLKSQLLFFILMYCVTFPLMFSIFALNVIPMAYILWFYVLLLLSHINQEIMRLLIVLSQPVLSTVILFIRSGLWSLLIVIFLFFEFKSIRLNDVLLFWLLGECLAFCFGLFFLGKHRFADWGREIDWRWIKTGLKICLPLLLSSLAIRTILTVDKYIIEIWESTDLLGVYTFFFSLSAAVTSFIDAGVIPFFYPKLISQYGNKEMGAYRVSLIQMFKQTMVIVCLFTFCAYFTLDYLLEWLNKEAYHQYASLFYYLLLVNVLYVIGLIPHYALYSQKKDKVILWTHLSAVFLFFIVVFLLQNKSSIYTMAIALIISFIWIALLKLYFSVRGMYKYEK